jgi:rare lipoprotein A
MKLRRGAVVGVVAALLVACSMPEPFGAKPPALRPLVMQPTLPPGAAPRSAVPLVRYELTVPGAGDLDDGFPEDPTHPAHPIFERGAASWYGIQFHRRKTANGERFDMTAFTAAHRTLPFNTRVCVRSLTSGREVLVRINDRGPHVAGRIIDLSRAAASAIGLVGLGINQVVLSVVDEGGSCADARVDEAELPAREARAQEAQDLRKVPAPPRGKVAPRKRR